MKDGEFKIRVLSLSTKVLIYAKHILKNEDDARDVVQDVFLKLWQKKEELGQVENMEAFVIRMTRNKCLDLLKAARKEVMDNENSRTIFQDTNDAHSRIELSESAKQIKYLIDQLPEIQRMVMQMHDLEQLDYGEIEELTGLQVNAIRVNLSRARKKVRDEYLKLNTDENCGNKTITAKLF